MRAVARATKHGVHSAGLPCVDSCDSLARRVPVFSWARVRDYANLLLHAIWMAQRRILHHYRRLTPNFHLVHVTGKTLLVAPTPTTFEAHNKMRGLLSTSSKPNALAGASICVALGASAFLCARAYSSSSSKRSREVLPAAGSRDRVPGTGKSQEGAGPEKAAATPTAAPKQPCGGCDCGLMEPGPLEGSMHAYERHIIICRWAELTAVSRCCA